MVNIFDSGHLQKVESTSAMCAMRLIKENMCSL